MRQQIQAGISQSSACAESYFFISFWNEGPKVLGTYFSRRFQVYLKVVTPECFYRGSSLPVRRTQTGHSFFWISAETDPSEALWRTR